MARVLAQWCVLLWMVGFTLHACAEALNEHKSKDERRRAILEVVVRFCSMLVLDQAGCFNVIFH